MNRPDEAWCTVDHVAIQADMDSGHLTYEQLEQLQDQIKRSCGYLYALRERIEQQKFPYDDKLRGHVTRVCDALHGLDVAVHYMASDRLTKRTPRERGELQRAYYVQGIYDPHAPVQTVERMQWVEAETPLEAIAKLARYGHLPTGDSFFVRVVVSREKTREFIQIPLTREAIIPAETMP